MRRRVAEIAPAAGTEETEPAPAGTRAADARLRDSELFLLVLALGAGIAAGLGVVVIDLLLDVIRHFAFAMPFGGHLSSAAALGPARLVAVPVVGGILAGLSSLLLRRWRPREVVDAIEANALFGGRMSLGDSLGLVWVTILSGGFGASVGMEAAYTQLGAAMASRLGRSVELRRDDMRTLVGCGAAGAIAAAFNAPLTGAFYAFELIIGSYTLQALAPVGIAALTGTLVVRGLIGSNPIFVVWHDIALSGSDYLAFFGVGLACGRARHPDHERGDLDRDPVSPAGGAALGAAGARRPDPRSHCAALSADARQRPWRHSARAALRVRAAVSRLGWSSPRSSRSAVSIGAGFRGGLFSSSLFLGALFGSLVGGLLVPVRARSDRRPADLCARRDGCGRCRDRWRADDDDHAGSGNDRRFFGDDRGHGRSGDRCDSRYGIGSAIPLPPGAFICAGWRSAAPRTSAGSTSC